MMKTRNALLLSLILAFTAGAAIAQPAPDPTGVGPFTVDTGFYRFAAAVMPEVISDRSTELWAEAQWPTDAPTPWPVIVVLHGNHATCGIGSDPRVDSSCQYTTTGTCPAGFVIVPNHEGYRYFTERLASWGYFVVSINANRGITCGGGIPGDSGLNLARGRLILKHIELLSEWSTGIDSPPVTLPVALLNALDFGRVGLAGHSRGGEGARAAYNQYLDPGSVWPGRIEEPVTFKGIFEIGAVDGQTSRVLDAEGTAWNQLLPMCDGDVSNLQGVKPFDRMMQDLTEKPVAPKSTYTVWGTNHNYYNNEWQQSDSSGCFGHTALFGPVISDPEPQQTVGLAAAMAFFRTHIEEVDPDVDLIRNFDTLYDLPAVVTDITRVDRGFILSPNATTSPVLNDFTGAFMDWTGAGVTVTYGAVPEHDFGLRAARITWPGGAVPGFFLNSWTSLLGSVDASIYDTLDFRISRSTSPLNPSPLVATDFSIRLQQAFVGENAGVQSAPLRLSSYAELLGPVGRTSGNRHSILQTVRIPLADFSGVDLTRLRGMRLTFDDTPTGEIYLADVRLGSFTESIVPPSPLLLTDAGEQAVGQLPAQPITYGNQSVTRQFHSATVTSLRYLPYSQVLGAEAIEVEISLADALFPVRNALAVLQAGNGMRSYLSRYPESGETNTLIFTFTTAEWDRIEEGVRLLVFYGEELGQSNWIAYAGALAKGDLR